MRHFPHVFRDASLLQQALTHRSLGHPNNERLEYLGDALINFIIGAELFVIQPHAEEGALSRLRASLVREETLARIARELKLGDALRLGESELKSGGYTRDSILADALEAVVGAVYLDSGFEAARETCRHLFKALLENLPDSESLKDSKTRLQEWLQARGRPLPRYEVLAESGPAHARRFAVRCVLTDAMLSAEAEAGSRRGAEQDAAQKLLENLLA